MKEAHLSRHGLPDAVSTLVDRPIEDPGEEVQDEVHGSNANQGTIAPFICEEMSTARDGVQVLLTKRLVVVLVDVRL